MPTDPEGETMPGMIVTTSKPSSAAELIISSSSLGAEAVTIL
jgi:hypothetical protein